MRKLLGLLFIGFLFFPSCTTGPVEVEGYTRLTIWPDENRWQPGDRSLGYDEKIYSWYFVDETKYIIDSTANPPLSGDQGDWNKLIGMSWSIFSNHVNSAMVGWRYNPGTELFELNGYFHISSETVYTPAIAYVEAYEKFETFIEVLPVNYLEWTTKPVVRLRIKTESGQFVEHLQEFQRESLPALVRYIATWQGGSIPAIHYMEMYRQRRETW